MSKLDRSPGGAEGPSVSPEAPGAGDAITVSPPDDAIALRKDGESLPEPTRYRRREPLELADQRGFQVDRPRGEMKLPVQRERRSFIGILIVLLTLAMGTAGTLYFGYYVTDRYVTEVHFTVNDSGGIQAGPGASAQYQGLGSQAGAAFTDTFLVCEYLRSPTIVADIQDKIDLRRIWGGAKIDWLSRFDVSGSQEDLEKYFKNRVVVDYDPMTATGQISVEAFTPQDSYQLAQVTMAAARALVNGMNAEMRTDMIKFADHEVELAAAHLERIRLSQIDLTKNPQASKTATGTSLFYQSSQLQIERDMAEQAYSTALTNLETARQQASRTQKYLVNFVNPVLPITPTKPIRWQMILSVWLGTFMLMSIVSLIISTVREHMF
jgi:capsule polysaccharide export protein KpsE/RkpR